MSSKMVSVTLKGRSKREIATAARAIAEALDPKGPDDEVVVEVRAEAKAEVPTRTAEVEHISGYDPRLDKGEEAVGMARGAIDQLQAVLRNMFVVGRKGRIIGGKYQYKHSPSDPAHIDREVWNLAYKLITERRELTETEVAWFVSNPDAMVRLQPVYADVFGGQAA